MEVKEAVKKVETIIKVYSDLFESGEEAITMKAMRTVLQELENKDKQIKELKAVNKMQEYRINEMDIPKKKIEDKIKELDYQTSDRLELYYKKEVLQKLLEDIKISASDEMNLEEALEYLDEMRINCIEGAIYTDDKAEQKAIAIKTVFKELERLQTENENFLFPILKSMGKNVNLKKKIEELITQLESKNIYTTETVGNPPCNITRVKEPTLTIREVIYMLKNLKGERNEPITED